MNHLGSRAFAEALNLKNQQDQLCGYSWAISDSHCTITWHTADSWRWLSKQIAISSWRSFDSIGRSLKHSGDQNLGVPSDPSNLRGPFGESTRLRYEVPKHGRGDAGTAGKSAKRTRRDMWGIDCENWPPKNGAVAFLTSGHIVGPMTPYAPGRLKTKWGEQLDATMVSSWNMGMEILQVATQQYDLDLLIKENSIARTATFLIL